jgi:hypothetical protein
MKNHFRLPGFTAETALSKKNVHFAAQSLPTWSEGEKVIPQLWCEGPLALGTRCCEMIGDEMYCYILGQKYTQF